MLGSLAFASITRSGSRSKIRLKAVDLHSGVCINRSSSTAVNISPCKHTVSVIGFQGVFLKELRQCSFRCNFRSRSLCDMSNNFSSEYKMADQETAQKHVFVSHTNPVTGKTDWIVQDENYDYVQEIARLVSKFQI